MNKSEDISLLANSLAVFQGKVESIKKDSINPFFKMKYASLTAIWEAIREPLAKEGLSVIQTAEPYLANDHLVLETMLIHKSGQWIGGALPIKPVKDDPQGLGSAITYARRYALCAILGIVADEDDDGESPKTETRKTEPAKVPPKKSTTISKESIAILAQTALDKGYAPSNVTAIIINEFKKENVTKLTDKEASELKEILLEGKYKD